MSDIYTLAHRVVVWLGPQLDKSKLAMSVLTQLGGKLEVTWENNHITSPDCTESADFLSQELLYDEET